MALTKDETARLIAHAERFPAIIPPADGIDVRSIVIHVDMGRGGARVSKNGNYWNLCYQHTGHFGGMEIVCSNMGKLTMPVGGANKGTGTASRVSATQLADLD